MERGMCTKVAQRERGSDERKKTEKSPVAPSYGQKTALGGVVAFAPPPGQNLTNGVHRLGPKGSQLGDPDPNPNRGHFAAQYGPNWCLCRQYLA